MLPATTTATLYEVLTKLLSVKRHNNQRPAQIGMERDLGFQPHQIFVVAAAFRPLHRRWEEAGDKRYH